MKRFLQHMIPLVMAALVLGPIPAAQAQSAPSASAASKTKAAAVQTAPTQNSTVKPIVKCQKYTEPAGFYCLQYPSHWEIFEKIGTAVFISKAENKQDPFREKVVIVTDTLRGKTLESYQASWIKRLKAQYSNVDIQRSEAAQLGSYSGWQLEYTLTSRGEVIQCKTMIIPAKTRVYSLTYYAAETSYELFVDMANYMMQSFQLL